MLDGVDSEELEVGALEARPAPRDATGACRRGERDCNADSIAAGA